MGPMLALLRASHAEDLDLDWNIPPAAGDTTATSAGGERRRHGGWARGLACAVTASAAAQPPSRWARRASLPAAPTKQKDQEPIG